jgi:hypothetical protein
MTPEETTFKLRVQAHDGSDFDAGYTGTVHFGSSDPGAVLPGATTFTPADQGRRIFTVTLRTAGSQVVTVRDSREGWLLATAAVRVLRPADLQFVLEAPESVPAGQPFGVTVNVMDASRRWQQGYCGRVRFACTDPAALLPDDYTFPGGEDSFHTFPSAVTLKTPGKWVLTVTDTALPRLTGSVTVTVRPVSGGVSSGSP